MLIKGVDAMQLICVFVFSICKKANVLMKLLISTFLSIFEPSLAFSEAKIDVEKRLTSHELSLVYAICALSKYVYTLERYKSNFEH